MDWFLYNGDLRHERVKLNSVHLIKSEKVGTAASQLIEVTKLRSLKFQKYVC